MTRRRIVYLSGSRADFGLLRLCLLELQANSGIELAVCVTGSHLNASSGNTARDIENSGLKIIERIPVGGFQGSGLEMAVAFGKVAEGIARALERSRPELLLLLGDRYEMLAAASAAVAMNIPIAHIHGGERSGTVDECFRHAISKLAHIHLVATQESANRLERMGEDPTLIFVVGAPGLDEMMAIDLDTYEGTCSAVGFDSDREFALVAFHPVVQRQDEMEAQIDAVIRSVQKRFDQIMVIAANTDPGGASINERLGQLAGSGLKVSSHVSRRLYLSLLKHSAVLVGNSSSGIIEAASFLTPVVDVGSRQSLRERSGNVVSADPVVDDIDRAIDEALKMDLGNLQNVYGNGGASQRISDILASVPLSSELLMKSNAY